MKTKNHVHYCCGSLCKKRAWKHAGNSRKKCAIGAVFAYCPTCKFLRDQMELFPNGTKATV